MTHTTRRKPLNARTAAVAVLAVVVAALTLVTTSGTSPAQAGARPDFRLPFQCNVKAELKTYYGHNPDDKKIDAYVYGQPTGAPITAMADGYVHESFSPGGIEIRHGGGWFSTYMHMSWHVPAGTWVKQGDRIGTMGDVGSPGAPHLHMEQLYNPNSDQNADNQHIVTPVLQGQTLVMHPDRPVTMTSTNCGGGGTPPPTPGKYWVDTFQAAPVFASATSTAQTGTLNQGTNYVYCKVWGREIRNGTSYNHWWLKTDPDSGPANQYVSAYYLSRWGNDEAKDNSGNVIPDCAPPAASKYWVDTYANAPVYASATSTSQTGTLYKGTNYVFCKVQGRRITGANNTYNSWWLKTDPDVGPGGQYVSAYYLSRWGNDEAKDNSGAVIPSC